MPAATQMVEPVSSARIGPCCGLGVCLFVGIVWKRESLRALPSPAAGPFFLWRTGGHAALSGSGCRAAIRPRIHGVDLAFRPGHPPLLGIDGSADFYSLRELPELFEPPALGL